MFQLRFRGDRYSSPEWTRLCLERSKNAALSVSFYWEGANYVDITDRPRHFTAVAATVGALLRHAERWVHVTLPLENQFLGLFSSAKDRFLRLQTITFLGMPDAVSKKLEMFAHTPQLRFLSLPATRGPDHYPPLPWLQLTHAFINPGDDVLITGQVAALAPGLRAIIIRDGPALSEHGWLHPPIPTPPLSPNMRKIVLLGNNAKSRCVIKTLRNLNTPQLKELHIINCAAWEPLIIPDFVQRSGCYLETMVLQESRLRVAELLHLLSTISTLETLVLTDNIPNAVTNAVLDALTVSGLNPVALPALTTLVITGTYLFGTGNLLAMLESRMAPQHALCPLANINITLPDRELTTLELERFTALPEVGSSRLLCVDKSRVPVRLQFGTAPVRGWRYTASTPL
ncbi:hypothetical protein DFH06DRAFT_1321109 [Mycena polygramma]|nr:hypothetical protein DFH06DRAFT_1321109 [Mycena polygramma]